MTTWKRKEIKEKGKNTFKANFWKCVATALILAIVGGGSAGAFGGGGNAVSHRDEDGNTHTINVVDADWNFEFDTDMDENGVGLVLDTGNDDQAEAEADVYFPSFDKTEWDSEVVGEHTENEISYKHLVYTRKTK